MRFIGKELHEKVLSEYLKISDSHKNATYLSENSVSLFLREIGNWMKKQTVKEISKQEHYTLLLDEATDESNRSELSLIARVVENEEIKNHFLSLLELRRGDAESIFKTVEAIMDKENLSMKKAGFPGMDDCSTMAGIYNGVRAYLEVCGFLIYIHCRNHRLTLCFKHLVPKYEDFVIFDSLLLNLFLLLKNSNVKSNIFEEVQNTYGFKMLKLIKVVITRWLSHGRAAERVLERYEPLIPALDEMSLRKKEPVVR